MSFKTTGILLVLVGVGLAVWFFAGKGQTSEFDQPKQPTAEKTFLIDPRPEVDGIVRIDVTNEDGQQFTFERKPAEKPAPTTLPAEATATKPGPWEITAPIHTKAEQWVVNALPSAFFNLKSQRAFVPGLGGEPSLKDAGLDPPRGTFVLTSQDGKQYTFQIGASVAVSNDTYLRVLGGGTDDKVHIVARNFDTELRRKLKDYRSKSLFPRKRPEPVALEIDYEGKHYALTRDENEQWIIEQPIKTYADNNKVSGLINRFGALFVKEFIDDAPKSLAPYGLDEPELVIRVRGQADDDGHQPEYTLLVGTYSDLEKKNRYVKLPDQPWVASVAQTSIDPLLPNLSELRDSRLVRFKADDVAAVELATPERTVNLKLEKGEWSGSGDLTNIEPAAVTDLLAAIEDIHAIDYVDQPEAPETYGLDAPRAALRITLRSAVEPVTILVGKNTPSGRNTYVQVSGQSSVLVISSAQADRIAIDPMSLRSRKLFAMRTGDIIAIDSTVDGRQRVLVRDEDWHMTTPPDAPIDAAALRDLLNDVAMLRASAVVGEGHFGDYGLDTPDAVLKFTVSDKAEPPLAGLHVLQLATHDGKTYARKDDEPFVFQLDPTVRSTLTGELIERRLLSIATDKVRAITLKTASGELTFERDSEGWKYATDPFVKLDPKRVGDAVKLLSELRVQRYLAYTGGDVAAGDLSTPAIEAVLTISDDDAISLRFSDADTVDGTRSGAWVEPQRLFVLPPGAIDHLGTTLDDYLPGRDTPDTTPPGHPS